MKKLFVLVVLGCFLFTGCVGMGKTPHPVDTYVPTDDKIDCPMLEVEMYKMRDDGERHYKKWHSERGMNIATGVIGAIAFWPALFIMDLSDKEEVEYNACKERFDYLGQLYVTKDCDFPQPTIDLERKKANCPYDKTFSKWETDKRCNPELKDTSDVVTINGKRQDEWPEGR